MDIRRIASAEKELIAGSFGFYRSAGTVIDPDDYDVVIANSFGTTTGDGSINQLIRDRGELYGAPKTLIMDRMLDGCRSTYGVKPVFIDGEISTLTGKNTGTIGVLEGAQDYMREHGLSRPLIVGHAGHVARIAMQARTLGMDPLIPRRMPSAFDAASRQIWTKNRPLWVFHELIGTPVLARRGQLRYVPSASRAT